MHVAGFARNLSTDDEQSNARARGGREDTGREGSLTDCSDIVDCSLTGWVGSELSSAAKAWRG